MKEAPLAPLAPLALLVDDDADVLRLASRFLEHKGLRTMTSESGFGVTNLVREHRPDVVVLDVMMPALDGEQIAALLLEKNPAVVIVFFSAVDEEAAEGLRARVPSASFINKTDGMQALHEEISHRLVGALRTRAR